MRQLVVAIAVALGLVASSNTDCTAQTVGDHTRKIVYKIDPLYPDLARRMSMQGTVRLEVVVAANGKLKHAEVLGGARCWPKRLSMRWRSGSGNHRRRKRGNSSSLTSIPTDFKRQVLLQGSPSWDLRFLCG